ncbi:bifunctional diaminohydroxyphosphoribosylaminopyrimidine deaminase/5-amino-6-(5-phosphoribosylamino)uracil reductase RibD [Cytobacillus firmus]|uniref:bifunctional diaminohydroxyphosphoribosylaminopyrimidine deaminase/5-amino-6-(5-phosphoribosylamino)uracil reductase RibD n=1 Tax=Cytobacillus firmus TaxID=1399 RepID=UPI00203EA963|nr:bifunctional diaminohydroxyphosphoribosylaminopyrimidine deaminase/5-amino-6-(5-phosphoribosylamino)uracil reductase RibD [Cytobacillus firmus]MCM3707363.1 bifunctional diaminohydroxyphosphoribosylaminopyrimidine deaminase/5-amino-6-(5-phosphoribosylamino)uracil reductase RibD [Cytobacillus firmus]
MNRDEKYMNMAIEMAKSTIGQTTPNPSVAAVVVRDNQVVGIGVHVKAGEPHAEVHALRMAGEKAKGAEIYVTLEPCSHFGKTPPCAKGIIDAGIKRVVIASVDPNPKVSGQGINTLRKAGIEVKIGLLKDQANNLNRAFFHYIQSNLPYVRLKTAISMDGKIATYTGESKWITGEQARNDSHSYRHQSDGILVGVNTVILDNPKLTTRQDGGGKQPVRIVLDTHLRTSPTAQLITDDTTPTWIFTGSQVSEVKLSPFFSFPHVEVIKLESEHIEIEHVLSILGERKITSLLVEGGATIADAFVRAGAVNEMIIYMAPKIIGGKEALTSVAGKGISNLKNVEDFEFTLAEKVGSDMKLIAVKKDAYSYK